MRDRVVQFPHRYQLVPVDGEMNVYDFVPVPGTVTEEGTPINKANMLSDETATLYGIANASATVNEALYKIPLASYMAFCSNVNADSLDAAFGKGNEDKVVGLGKQLAMYAWYKGTSRSVAFTNLIKHATLSAVLDDENAVNEILLNEPLLSLIALSPFASSLFYTEAAVESWKKNASVIETLITSITGINLLRQTPVLNATVRQGEVRYTQAGTYTFTVPDGVTCLWFNVIGAGSSDNNSGGQLVQKAVPVASGDQFNIVVGDKDNNSIVTSQNNDLEIVSLVGGGALLGEDALQDGIFLWASKAGRTTSAYSGNTLGGGGGYDGGDGGYTPGSGGYVDCPDNSPGGAPGSNGLGTGEPGVNGGGGQGSPGSRSTGTYTGSGGGGGYGGGAGQGGYYSSQGTTSKNGSAGQGAVIIFM